MKVEQIYELVNQTTGEVLGKTDLVAADLSNVVDVGKELFSTDKVDNYVKKLLDKVGKMVFANRPYQGTAPSVLMDSWEYGSVLEKITAELPDANENKSWALEAGTVYEQDTFTPPTVSSKFFDSKTTFEIPMSFTRMQLQSSFQNAGQLNAFLSMIESAIQRSITVKTDSLISATINNAIAATLATDYPSADYGAGSKARSVNLFYEFKQLKPTTTATADTCLSYPEFLRYASERISLYESRLSRISTLFNIGGKDRFTPRNLLHLVCLADFEKAMAANLYTDSFHNEFIQLPGHDTVPFWQGSGQDYSFKNVSSIKCTPATNDGAGSEVTASGILAVMFDRDALGVANLDRRITTHYNARAEFYNNWYKADAAYFNDFNENFVVFYVADAPVI